ncbi:farnesyl pyrophosphate synthase-like [Stomoxys calcitrans]|nr:farnesyl pyrophosphate synthase-like [Stomoxys calcitrans]
MNTVPEILHDIRQLSEKYSTKDTSQWLTKCLEFNLTKGKKNRGFLVVQTFKELGRTNTNVSAENIRLSYILGWITEIMQYSILMADDIIDNSSTRRGQICWHNLNEVGLMAINDFVMVHSSVYALLQKYFKTSSCYFHLFELYKETMMIMASGASLELLISKGSVESFSRSLYETIVTNKTATTLYFPFALAMHLADVTNPEAFRQVKIISMEMGRYFQVQDDYLDCFGDPKITGKIGTDIEENKCSWLAVECMNRANNEQKLTMLECYGKYDPKMIQRVKNLYKSLELPKLYTNYEEIIHTKIKRLISNQTSNDVPCNTLLLMLDNMYQRTH